MRTEYDDVIRAWLDGAEVEEMHPQSTRGVWVRFDGIWVTRRDSEWQYRLVEPAKEPKYLWVYHDAEELTVKFTPYQLTENPSHLICIGKIRLEE